ncbi:MAG TPA: DUF1127 domain-containing protein [Hyphomicrobiaceae bacterium]|nr:DUF1127 domain-containing protein [Hyphomicrobiaceae bacterium]
MSKIIANALPGALELGRPVGNRLVAILGHVGLAFRVAAERRQLAALDDASLKDIGLSRSVAYREASRSILDLPADRLPPAE